MLCLDGWVNALAPTTAAIGKTIQIILTSIPLRIRQPYDVSAAIEQLRTRMRRRSTRAATMPPTIVNGSACRVWPISAAAIAAPRNARR